MITLESHISLSSQVLFQEVENEAVLLDLKSEQYFGLDGVGVQLWKTLERDGRLAVAHQTLLALYDVESDQLANDLITLLDELKDAGLVTVS